jgi:hypothetical protein
MVFWAATSRDPFLWAWVALWVGCFAFRRIESIRLWRQGVRIHSYYDGWPRDGMNYVKSEKIAKLVVEPVLVGLLGGFVMWIYSENGWPLDGLPRFLLLGCFTLPAVETIKQLVWHKRVEAVKDARIEQEQQIMRYRDQYGDE